MSMPPRGVAWGLGGVSNIVEAFMFDHWTGPGMPIGGDENKA
jgi:hypothetical protein